MQKIVESSAKLFNFIIDNPTIKLYYSELNRSGLIEPFLFMQQVTMHHVYGLLVMHRLIENHLLSATFLQYWYR